MGVEGKEGADTIVVGPVKEQMAEQGDEGEAIEEAPPDWHGLLGWVNGFIFLSAQTPAMEQPYGSDDESRFQWQAKEGVGPAAMVLEACEGSSDRPERVEIGSFGCEGHCEGGVGGLTVEASAGEDSACHQVGDGFHICCDVSLFR